MRAVIRSSKAQKYTCKYFDPVLFIKKCIQFYLIFMNMKLIYKI